MNKDHSDLDDVSYFRFTARQELEKAFHTLKGIVTGLTLDGKLEPTEIQELKDWCAEHPQLKNRNPFCEVISRIDAVLSDGIVTSEEAKDLLWVCSNITEENPYFDAVTADIQILQGVLHGVIADGKIDKEELTRLGDWMSQSEHLRGCYPYDELDALLTSVLKDGTIDEREHEALLRFFKSFVCPSLANRVRQVGQPTLSTKELTLPGICAVCPSIEFPDHHFCITGFSCKGKKSVFATSVERLGGVYVDDVPAHLDYLVVGAMGNPAWAFSCYGRKVEAATRLRKQGKRLLIVHENDFWDAIEDVKAGIA